MPRNGSGTMIPPAGTSPLLPNTIADASKVEARFVDLESEITQSLPRSGVASMSGPLRFANGSIAAPGATFENDTDSGFANVSDRIHLIKDGVSVLNFDANDIATTQPASFSSPVTFLGPVTFPASGGPIPSGVIVDFAGTVAPAGWLLCFGQAISRSEYAALFAAIGTTYGSGDGSTTFNLPDARGRARAGKDNMGGTSANRLTGLSGGIDGDVLGATGGAESHVLTVGQMPAHGHTATVTDPGHTHLVNSNWIEFVGFGGTVSLPGGGAARAAQPSSQSSTTGISVSIGSNGSDQAHNNVQPTIILNVIIKI